MKYTIVAKILAGFFGGWILHSFLFIMFTHRFNDYDAAKIIFWVMVALETTIGAIVGAMWFPMAFILSTSYVGAYLFFRCIGAFADGFTNEFVINKERDEGRYDNIAYQNYLYISFTIILGTFSVFVQYKINNLKYYKKDDAEKKGFDRL